MSDNAQRPAEEAEVPDATSPSAHPSPSLSMQRIAVPSSIGGGLILFLGGFYGYLDSEFASASEQRAAIRFEIQRDKAAAAAARRELEISIDRCDEHLADSIRECAHDRDRLHDEIVLNSGDRWRATEMVNWALRLANANPTLVVPEPK